MDKRLLFGMFAASTLALGTSCSNEEIFEQTSGDTAIVSFNLQTPGSTLTRAEGNGGLANKLVVAVYDEDGNLIPGLGQTKDCSNLLTGENVSLKLVKGQTYKVAFWAQNSSTEAYTITDGDLRNVQISYEGVNNDKTRDAFCWLEEITVGGNAQRDIELKRPLAQVNVGASDYEVAKNAGVVVSQSKATIKQASKALNVLTGEPSTETIDVEFALASIPDAADGANTLEVEGETYKWMSMCYILPSEKEQSTTVETSFEFKDTNTGRTVTLTEGLQNTPIQRNYRTNIIGNLLTSNVDFRIKVDNNFQDYYIVSPWDGVTLTEPALEGNTWKVSTAAEWAWLANNYWNRGVTNNITLTQDIDFNNHEIKAFNMGGTFDGQGHVVRNIVQKGGNGGLFTSDALYPQSFPAGLDIAVKNVTFENVKVDYNQSMYAGVVFNSTQNGHRLLFENVTINNSDVKGINGVGTFIGSVSEHTTCTLKNCKVEGSYLHNYGVAGESGYVCGLVGRVAGKLTFDGVDMKDVVVDGIEAAERVGTVAKYTKKRLEAAVVEGEGTIREINPVVVRVISLQTGVVSSDEEFAAAIARGEQNIILNPGTYNLGGRTIVAANTTIIGSDKEGCKLNLQKSVYFEGKNLTLKNLTYNVPTGLNYDEFNFGFIHRVNNFSMEDCLVNGRLRLNLTEGMVKNCEFKLTENSGFDGYAIYYYGASSSKLTVEDCEFNTAGKAIVMYNESPVVFDLTVNNCSFVSSNSSTDKAAIQMHTEWGITGKLKINNSTATGFKDIHNGLWNCLNNNTSAATTAFEVTVDGTRVQ